ILRAYGAHDMPSARYTVCQKQTILYIASRCDMFRFAERKGKNPPRRIFIIAWRLSKSVLFVDIEIHLLFKTKSAPTEADAQKTQTPIVAKLTLREKAFRHNYINEICVFIKFICNRNKKYGYSKMNKPLTHIKLVWHTYYTT
ncbi:MAG: hypothetical protein IJB43_04125, partial [Clostridia bacterium]|nr:hypothetical protein [Clostridia bacterium]